MKKQIALILSFIFIFSSFTFIASAIENDSGTPFSFEVYPEKQSYSKCEDIKIGFKLKNTSLDKITDMRIWLDYPLTDYYITPGVTERFIMALNESETEIFRVVEDKGVLNFASKFENTKLIKSFLLKLAHTYKKLTLAFSTVRYGFQNSFISFRQKKVDLGTVKVMYDNTEIEFTVKCRYSVKKSEVNTITEMSSESGIAVAEVKAVENSYTGLVFAADENKNEFGLFAINPDSGKAYIYSVKDGIYNLTSTKSVNIKADNFYQMKTIFNGDRVICYLSDNPYDTNPYPVFDLSYSSDKNSYSVYSQQDGYKNFTVTAGQIPQYEKSYTNPVYDNAPDPYILIDNGTYYLYATTDPGNGYRVSSSTDLVNWKSLGVCAKKGDIYENGDFWAPEVYAYNNKYYLLYSTDEHLAIASSSSPAGPFKKCSDNYIFEHEGIDGHLFLDDDGKYYLYYAYFGDNGSEIYGCRFNMDTCTADISTLTQLSFGKEDEHGVNEGPYMLKYQGKYYLTYSVNGYEKPIYSVRLAVSDSPLGVYEGKGTILERSGSIIGTGHHCFTTSPDGKELIIAYHCHYSTTQIHNRRLCIDRCKFIETDDGYTISVYGPTSTPQPYPAS